MSAPRAGIGLCGQLACVWEATARKAGNVHRFRDFDDVNYLDFVASALAIGPVLERAAAMKLGDLVLEAILQTRRVAATNTNLGMVLLLAPLARAAALGPVPAKLPEVLAAADLSDTAAVFEAIRLARPGGLGSAPEQDVHNAPTQPLRAVMALAAQRDLIALQYANGFREVLQEGVPALGRYLEQPGTLECAIVACHLTLLGQHPDSLIARKCGRETAVEASRRAAEVLNAGWPHTETGRRTFAALDTWLRADGHRRNPGATADLVAACLFVALREGIITLPVSWSADFLGPQAPPNL